MTEREAYALLPKDAVWSSSFGHPVDNGFSEFFRRPNGERWEVYRISHNDWTAERVKP